MWFAALFAAYLVGVMIFTNAFFSQNESLMRMVFLPLITAAIFIRIGMVVITIYYGLKLNIKSIWAWLLGLSILVTGIMIWVAFIIFMTRKVPKKAGL